MDDIQMIGGMAAPGTSLKTRLVQQNEVAFLTVLTALGYEEMPHVATPEISELLKKLTYWANTVSEAQMIAIEKWEKEGRPE